ncbi:hypothetical protein F5Y11DRAFT_331865 [Daldinia sp. FL1419]|nr:hypothetical protein F5Y11DRAFT_331865 [Daldinia sp. FL1419]
MSNESDKRLQTTLGGFSEVTALTQRAINAAMTKMVTDRPELAHVDCKAKRGDSLKGIIAEPLVSLKVTGPTRAGLEYTARFGSGTLHFNYDPPLDFDTEDWVIAFDVELDKVDLEPGSDEDKAVRAAINQPGDFSLQSLFLTFNSGDITKLNGDHCDFKGANLDDDDKYTLGSILAKWYIDEGPMVDRTNRTIGYHMLTSKPSSVNQQAPTFPPTSLKFQTYEYIGPGQTEPAEGIPAGNNNMLLYLQMTDNKPFPPTAILPYTGNFASRDMDGTMSIERSIFWDNYLLRVSPATELLHTLNHATYVWIKHADIDNRQSPNWEIGVGDSNHSASPSFFHWIPQGDMLWTWGQPRKDNEQYYYHETDAGWGVGELEVSCNVINTMSTSPGSNVIRVTGKSDVKVDSSCGSGSPFDPWDTEYGVHVWASWDTTITINAVDSGGLKIVIDLDENNFKVDNDPLYYLGGGYPKKSDIEKKQNGLVDNLKNALRNSALQDVADELQKNLDNAARFVVPGLGVFKYKDPMFNNNGDLFISVEYQ